MAQRKKSLLIGINYVGTQHELKGCHSDVDNIAEFLSSRGYENNHRDRVILSDNPMVTPDSPYYPSGHNMLAAMDWLVSLGPRRTGRRCRQQPQYRPR